MVELISRYGLLGSLKLAFFVLRSKMLSKHIKLIRFPIDLRNKKFIHFGKGFTSGVNCRLETYPENNNSNDKIIEFGENVQINDNVHIVGIHKVKIGNNVLMASKIFISDCNHGTYKGENQSSPKEIPSKRILKGFPVEIKDNVWIGESVCIMPGVTIGEGCIIGAMSVVTKNIPDFTIALGSPAKIIKKYNFSTKKWELI